MKKIFQCIVAALFLASSSGAANAQFVSGQVLTAIGLNNAFAAKTDNAAAAITGGTITGLSAPLPVASGGTGAISLVGLFTPSNLAAQAADTILANATASSASPTAFAMPSCSTSTSALQYTSGTGFTCYASSATTTGTLAQFSSTTSAQLAGVISDETGSGSLVFSTSPTIGTPTINTPTISGGTINNASVGATTASTGRFTTVTATSTITPSSTSGIVGTATNDSANAGSVGEFISSTVLVGSAVSLSNNVPANVTSISLTAGDWDVSGNVAFNNGGATVQIAAIGAITTTSATLPTIPNNGAEAFIPATFNTGQGPILPVGTIRLSLSATTTVFLIVQSAFSGGTSAGYGFIGARRRR